MRNVEVNAWCDEYWDPEHFQYILRKTYSHLLLSSAYCLPIHVQYSGYGAQYCASIWPDHIEKEIGP